MQLTDLHREYWSKNLRITTVLMTIWLAITVLPVWFARELVDINLGGWPLSFYMAAQGSLIVYVLLIWYYSKRMGELDHEFGVDED
jgi:putative solute:sodium symporter small subunit